MWEHAEKNHGKQLKKSAKFQGLVRRCLALPFILLTELQEVVDDLRTIEMDTEAAGEEQVCFWFKNLKNEKNTIGLSSIFPNL